VGCNLVSNLRRRLRLGCGVKRLSSFMICNKSNTSGPETSYPSEATDVVYQHLSFCPISFGHYIVCYSSIALCLLVTSLLSSDVSH
jgi:hypothetical protein